jgi:hypothetical protein
VPHHDLADDGRARVRPTRRPARRPRSVGTKLTEDEYAGIAAAAGTLTISEWVRATVLVAATGEPAERVILAELLALRAILLTLHFAVAAGEGLTAEAMQRLIDRADQDKLAKAQARLATPSTRRPS